MRGYWKHCFATVHGAAPTRPVPADARLLKVWGRGNEGGAAGPRGAHCRDALAQLPAAAELHPSEFSRRRCSRTCLCAAGDKDCRVPSTLGCANYAAGDAVPRGPPDLCPALPTMWSLYKREGVGRQVHPVSPVRVRHAERGPRRLERSAGPESGATPADRAWAAGPRRTPRPSTTLIAAAQRGRIFRIRRRDARVQRARMRTFSRRRMHLAAAGWGEEAALRHLHTMIHIAAK